IRSDDKRAADLYQQATTAAEADNFAKARVLAEAVIRLAPDHVGARGLRARAALEQGDGQAAFDDYLAAIRLDPRFAPHHRGLGRALLAMKRYAEAAQAFERALAIDPGDLEAIQLRESAAKLAKLPKLPEVPEGK
ncbi:MAG: tetratricopeptide repeat protein, partial [Planctomycetota bacterium]